LPFETGRYHSAHGLRTWQFARALALDGHRIEGLLVDADDSAPVTLPEAYRESMRFTRLDAALSRDRREVRRRLDAARPDAVVGATVLGSYFAAESGHPAPLWIDLNGDPIAEGQALARARRDDGALDTYRWALAWCGRRGDRFSTVSPPQRWATLGELALLGRANLATAEVELVHVVPESCELDEAPVAIADRGAFGILVSGSFNTWTDGVALTRALATVLAARSDAVVEITGGGVAGHDEIVWQEFGSTLEAAGLASRVVRHGWVESSALAAIEARSSCGVVPELPLVERELGGQNRSLRWMARGLPVLTTGLSEVGRQLAAAGGGLLYPPGDGEALASALLALLDDRPGARLMGERARSWVAAERSLEATTRPLRDWAGRPVAAPDRLAGTHRAHAARLAEIVRDQLELERRGDGETSDG